MRLKLCSLSSTDGFTILELLVVMGLGMLILGVSLGSAISNRSAFLGDLYRTQLSQNLRGAMDIIGSSARQAGENLPGSFPAVEIVNGANGGSDELILRKNIIDEVLKVCVDLTADSNSNRIYFSETTGVSGCAYSDQTHNFTTWRSERNSNGGTLVAYIYDQSTNAGEFFEVTNEVNSGTDYYLEANDGSWARDYMVGASAVYYLEEWRFLRFESSGIGFLQAIENGNLANPINVARDVSNLTISARLADGTTVTSFDATNDWTDLRYVEVTLSGLSNIRGFSSEKSLTGRYFPRNVLSN